jgi:hypothetical protein
MGTAISMKVKSGWRVSAVAQLRKAARRRFQRSVADVERGWKPGPTRVRRRGRAGRRRSWGDSLGVSALAAGPPRGFPPPNRAVREAAGKGVNYGVPHSGNGNDMPRSEKDHMASEVQERWIDFQMALSDKRKYPIAQFKAFWEAGKRYAELTKHDALIHRVVVEAVNGLTDFLSVERKRVPGLVLRDAERLESMVFSG